MAITYQNICSLNDNPACLVKVTKLILPTKALKTHQRYFFLGQRGWKWGGLKMTIGHKLGNLKTDLWFCKGAGDLDKRWPWQTNVLKAYFLLKKIISIGNQVLMTSKSFQKSWTYQKGWRSYLKFMETPMLLQQMIT